MKARNWQTGEIKEGTFEELADLDKRLWDVVDDDEEHTRTWSYNGKQWVVSTAKRLANAAVYTIKTMQRQLKKIGICLESDNLELLTKTIMHNRHRSWSIMDGSDYLLVPIYTRVHGKY